MLRKILRASDRQTPPEPARRHAVEKALARLTMEPPNTPRAALVRTNGLIEGCFPSAPPVHQDRISAMSAVIESLGARISRGLDSGERCYNLIAGVRGSNLVIVLNDDYLLALGVPRQLSLDAAFDGLRLSLIPLRNCSRSPSCPSDLVISLNKTGRSDILFVENTL